MTSPFDRLVDMVAQNEGFRGRPYRDSRGYVTVGYGFCLDVWPLSEREARVILEMRLRDVLDELSHQPWFRALDESRQRAIADMTYNIGLAGVLTFHDMLSALEDEEWDRAANAMLDSEWAGQVGERAYRDAALIRGDKPDE